jgi:uncharacterized protein with PQ loop repeat
MPTASQLLGFGGVALGFIGYLPQILHLIGQECSAGISIRAYLIWLAAAVLLLIHALVIFDGVFILLQSLGACLDVTVIAFAARYQGRTCPLHS